MVSRRGGVEILSPRILSHGVAGWKHFGARRGRNLTVTAVERAIEGNEDQAC